MEIETSRFGKIKINDEKVIKMVQGLYGFSEISRFVILEHKDSTPFKWFQSLECSDLAFVIAEPATFFPSYRISLNPEDKDDLQLKAGDEFAIYVLVVIPNDPKQMTANMLGPIVINSDKMLAKQVILVESVYTTRESLFQAS